ncbi:MAG TPA: sulfotransferase [Sphingobium sp.]
MSAPGLPGFLIIGAVKAATTWIHAQLQGNPALYLPDPEPHYFSSDYDRGIDFYRAFFAGAPEGALLGEKSADYLAHPHAASRIAALLPHVPMVVQLRNPVDRAYSDYCMLYRRGTVQGPPEAYFDRATTTQPRFLDDGLYAAHLDRWYDLFDPTQIHVLLFEDVKKAPHLTVAQVCEHIGAPYHFVEALSDRPVNDGSAHFLPLALRTALAPLKDSVRPLRNNPVFNGVRNLLVREMRYPPLLPDTRARLVDFYAADVERLGRMLGRDLGHWLDAERMAA